MNIMPKKKELKTAKSNKELQDFLKKVKTGRYATIEKSSIKYSRVQEQTEVKGVDTEEYYYSMS